MVLRQSTRLMWMILPRPKPVFPCWHMIVTQQCNNGASDSNRPTRFISSSGTFRHASQLYFAHLDTKSILAPPDESTRYIRSIKELTRFNGTAMVDSSTLLFPRSAGSTRWVPTRPKQFTTKWTTNELLLQHPGLLMNSSLPRSLRVSVRSSVFYYVCH